MFHLPTVQFTEEQEHFRLEFENIYRAANGKFMPKCDSWLSGMIQVFQVNWTKGLDGMTWPIKIWRSGAQYN